MTCLPLHRRRLLGGTLALLALPLAAPTAFAAVPQVQVWKDPACGCCQDWVKHLNAHRIATRVHDSGNVQARARLGIPERLGSCHTGWIAVPGANVPGGYAIEGHVPARAIHRLLADRPNAIGLAVPGMPIGSPGMDGPAYGGRRDAYDVLLVLADGGTRVFQREG